MIENQQRSSGGATSLRASGAERLSRLLGATLSAATTDAVIRAGAEVDLASPPGRQGILAVSGRLYVELADGRRLHGKGGFGASYGDFFGDRQVSREEVETTILRRVGKARPSPRRLGWDQLRRVLAKEGLAPGDDELMQLPFEIEFSDELLQVLDGGEPRLPL